ncbi:MAG: hypothetical protein FWH03_07855 [Firmicutes bacterium]|nr:hypothetical protein [Bacillota bacterium]
MRKRIMVVVTIVALCFCIFAFSGCKEGEIFEDLLEKHKETTKRELSAYPVYSGQRHYGEAVWAAIESIIAEGKNKIDTAVNVEEIASALLWAKNGIDDLPLVIEPLGEIDFSISFINAAHGNHLSTHCLLTTLQSPEELNVVLEGRQNTERVARKYTKEFFNDNALIFYAFYVDIKFYWFNSITIQKTENNLFIKSEFFLTVSSPAETYPVVIMEINKSVLEDIETLTTEHEFAPQIWLP